MKDRKLCFLPFISKYNRVDISDFSVEDFVLDEGFRIWVLSPSKTSNIRWDQFLRENPSQASKAEQARQIILNLSTKQFYLSETESSNLWGAIDSELDELDSRPAECKVVHITSEPVLKKYETHGQRFLWYSQWLRVAGVLVLAFSLSIGVNWINGDVKPQVLPELAVYEAYETPPGVKSTLTLQDGTKVMLNSGSSIRYIKNFEANQRLLYLKGEAYFEVSKDSLRPFSVITDGVTTTAIGTAFNISAYRDETINVSLVEGKVAVEVDDENETLVTLEKGEGLKVSSKTGIVKKGQFDTELTLAWTKKRIVFQQIKMVEAIRVLENWYGVEFKLRNQPKPDLYIYGVYEDEILENVLESLSYTARFEYKIDQDVVEIFFK